MEVWAEMQLWSPMMMMDLLKKRVQRLWAGFARTREPIRTVKEGSINEENDERQHQYPDK